MRYTVQINCIVTVIQTLEYYPKPVSYQTKYTYFFIPSFKIHLLTKTHTLIQT